MVAGLTSLCTAELAAPHWPLNGRDPVAKASGRAVSLVCMLHAVLREGEGEGEGVGMRSRIRDASHPSVALSAVHGRHYAATKPAQADAGGTAIASL